MNWMHRTALASLSVLLAAPVMAANSDWTVLGGGDDVQHYSALDQVNEQTVSKLGLAWYANIPTLDGLVGNPLVADGVVYQSGALAKIFANDLRTGKLLWSYSPTLNFGRDVIGTWANRFNRGVALWEDKVIVATGDCRVIAVYRATGKVAWEAQSCDPAESMGITGAPRVGGGKVFVGNTCGDIGAARGFVEALDARTGARKWRFYTVPSDDPAQNDTAILKKARDTWGKEGLKITKGCGSPWDAMTYDPVLNLVYFGTGGPAPFNPKDRAADKGDELFSTAIVAVNADTGAYVWHYTTTPNDAWNFDATMHTMVADLRIDGRKRRVVMQAPKNGFFYVLDAKTGELLRANNFARVNWASHIDMKTGRPVLQAEGQYYDRPGHGSVVFPGPAGAHNWHAMSYNPKTGLIYIPSQEIPTLMKVMTAEETGGGVSAGGTTFFDLLYGLHDPKYRDQLYGELIAWDPVGNKARWRVRHELPVNGGTLSTAGNLVFQGTADGQFLAYDAAGGKPLWKWQGDGSIQSAPTTVAIDGQQYILVASGNSASANLSTYTARLTTTEKSRGPSRLLAFKLGGTAALPEPTPSIPFAKPSRPPASQDVYRRGELFFEFNACVACHGMDAVAAAGSVPDLRRMSESTYANLHDIVIGGAYQARGMPAHSHINEDELAAIASYLTNKTWDAYNEQERAKAKP